MRYFMIFLGLGILTVVGPAGCSTQNDDKAALMLARAEAEKHKAEADRLRAELERLKKERDTEKKAQALAAKYGGIEPRVVAAWEKAGARFGWFVHMDSHLHFLEGGPRQVRSAKPASGPALPSFVFKNWPPPGGLQMLPKPAAPFGLSLERLKVTDGWMKELAAFDQLQKLDLNWTQVTDAGLKDLAALPKLDALYLNHTQVTNAGLKHVAALPKLKALYLYETPITDDGLKELAALKQLYTLDIGLTKVTTAGVAELRRALPKLGVTGK